MTDEVSFDPTVVDWWRGLSPSQKERVRRWLEGNPPPAEWTDTPIGWAFTEMPFGPFGSRSAFVKRLTRQR